MKKDAEAHADEDAKAKESAEARNLADQMVYTSEKALKDQKGKVPEDVRKSVEEKIKALKKVKDDKDNKVVKAATEA